MRFHLFPVVACVALAGVALNGAEKSPTPRRHPLRGVITAVHPDRAAIMVKHEEIPGVMRAMTMLFRVDDRTLATVKQGQAITAQMSRVADEWWLHEVKVVAGKKD